MTPILLARQDRNNCKNKDEIQGSLHCATDDKTVRCSGRDDVYFGLGGREQATATAKCGDSSPSTTLRVRMTSVRIAELEGWFASALYNRRFGDCTYARPTDSGPAR